MKKVLVLGAGLVARPLVNYLLDEIGIQLQIASRTLSKAENLINGHPNGSARQLNVENEKALQEAVRDSDLVISLLPWVFHLKVARLCLKLQKNLVTTSYVKPEMQALDAEARSKGLLFLNEIGVDPGIDHMAAMQTINAVKKAGGTIKSFYSYCGGLPAPENNTNPLGYKFSWSPSGVMLAANNDGRYLKDGKIINVSSAELFGHYWLVDIPAAGTFEAYVNRDALPYIDKYDIETADSMYRGTLRNIGHCESWNYFKKLGLLDQQQKFDFRTMSPAQVLAKLADSDGLNLSGDIAAFLGVPAYSVTIHKLQWLGLLSREMLPLGEASLFDMFAFVLQNKLVYAEDELDLLLQHHEFIAEYGNGKKEKITSTMVDRGIRGGDSSMARTVSLPAAIATKLILNKKIDLTGVHIPVLAEVYEPVLAELEAMNIRLVERRANVS